MKINTQIFRYHLALTQSVFLVLFLNGPVTYGDLVVYTYDSLAGKGSLGELIEKEYFNY